MKTSTLIKNYTTGATTLNGQPIDPNEFISLLKRVCYERPGSLKVDDSGKGGECIWIFENLLNKDELPERCFAVLNTTGDLIELRKNIDGYYPLSEALKDDIKKIFGTASNPMSNSDIADQLNTQNGITKQQRVAMEWGSCMGWQGSLAMPASYDPTGKPYSAKNPKPSKKISTLQPEFYYEWGNEPAGMVSTGCYINDVFHSTGQITKTEAAALKLEFNNPHS